MLSIIRAWEPVSYGFWRISKQHFPCVAAWGGVQNFVTVKNYIFLTGNFNSGTKAGFVNKGFLFATSSIRIKSHVVESQITLLVWPCLAVTEKQRTINHMTIFNNSIGKFYQCSIQGFCWCISMFLVSTSTKKKANAETIKLLGILKKICLQE